MTCIALECPTSVLWNRDLIAFSLFGPILLIQVQIGPWAGSAAIHSDVWLMNPVGMLRAKQRFRCEVEGVSPVLNWKRTLGFDFGHFLCL